MNVLLVVYDNESYIHYFPLGLAYIASALRNAGHEVEIYSQDVYHYPESHLVEHLKKKRYDVIGFNFIAGYYPYRKLLKISEVINSVPNRPFYLLGGHGPSPDPEFFMKKTKANAVCIGEGDITIVELMEAIEGNRSFHSVKGIAFMENGRCIQTERRELIQDLDSIPFPAWDLFPMDYYVLIRSPNIRSDERSGIILSNRGCLFSCNFCYRLDKGLRMRSPQNVIEEIKMLKEKYNCTFIKFADELFISSPKRAIEMSQAFINAKLNIRWTCNGRLNWATPKVLEIMSRSGCVFINYGIESVDDKILSNMNKGLTVAQIHEGIKNTLAAGISPGYNIIFGNIGEDEETLQQGVDFLLKFDDGAQLRTIRPVTPYPGTPLFDYAIEKGLLKDIEDFYENKHLNSDLVAINFTELSDDKFHEILYKANKALIENYFQNKANKMIDDTKKLYFGKELGFRGFRQT